MAHTWKMAAMTGPVLLIAVSAFANYYIPDASLTPLPAMVKLPAGTFDYRASGSFIRGNKFVEAPMIKITVPRPFAMMVHQVSAADYRRCVNAKACPASDGEIASSDLPAVKISWRDAMAYAAWLSRETGVRFRLPADTEWVYAAASRFKDDELPSDADSGNPGKRQLAAYEREIASDGGLNQRPLPLGSFGVNENGLIDLAGNVWEWTETCFTRSVLDKDNGITLLTSSCGIRVAEGRHRAYIADFVRDARGGGCSGGTPPSNLGFRLVREDSFLTRTSFELRRLFAKTQHLIGLIQQQELPHR
jgi:formylglycine-generating enzyme required for sulfatase activity